MQQQLPLSYQNTDVATDHNCHDAEDAQPQFPSSTAKSESVRSNRRLAMSVLLSLVCLAIAGVLYTTITLPKSSSPRQYYHKSLLPLHSASKNEDTTSKSEFQSSVTADDDDEDDRSSSSATAKYGLTVEMLANQLQHVYKGRSMLDDHDAHVNLYDGAANSDRTTDSTTHAHHDKIVSISSSRTEFDLPHEPLDLTFYGELATSSDYVALACQRELASGAASQLHRQLWGQVVPLQVTPIKDILLLGESDHRANSTRKFFTWHIDAFPTREYHICQYHLYRARDTVGPATAAAAVNTQEVQSASSSSPSSNSLYASMIAGISSVFQDGTAAAAAPAETSDDLFPFIHKAKSPILDFRHMFAQTPTQIHLSLGNYSDQMVVSFTTSVESVSKPVGRPIAAYSSDPKSLNRQTTSADDGWTTTYSFSDMCSAPANQTDGSSSAPIGWFHTVRLNGLQPSTVYYYKVGMANGQGIVWSDTINHFRSPPQVGTTSAAAVAARRLESTKDPEPSGDAPFSYIVFGDHGTPTVWGNNATKWLMEQIVDLELSDGNSDNNNEISSSWWKRHRHHHHHRPSLHPSSNDDDKAGTNLIATMIHHIGDISYARGNSAVWDEWFQIVEPVSSLVPYMITIGNHEYDHTVGGGGGKDPSGVPTDSGFMPSWGNFGDDSGGECGVPMAKRFTMPSTPSDRKYPSNGVFWYSFDYALVHTVGLSSEHDMSEGSDLRNWLEEDLASVNRTLTPWVVVEIHRPFYDSQISWKDTAVSIGMRLEVESLMKKYKVDLIISGHFHAYMRTCDGLYRSRCENNNHTNNATYPGPIHLTVGTAGASFTTIPHYPNNWTPKHLESVYGYGRITVYNATSLHFEFVKVGAPDDETAGMVLDDVWVARQR